MTQEAFALLKVYTGQKVYVKNVKFARKKWLKLVKIERNVLCYKEIEISKKPDRTCLSGFDITDFT